MNTPAKPQDPPSESTPPGHNPTGKTPGGIPKGMEEHDAKGSPTSDRQQTEKSATG